MNNCEHAAIREGRTASRNRREWCLGCNAQRTFHGGIWTQWSGAGLRRVHRKEPVETRFWRLVQKGEGCWPWLGHVRRGYGQFKPTAGLGLIQAHRFSWFLAHGENVPDHLECCHHCDNRPCVRPDHLFIGTKSDNMLDMGRKGRNAMQLRPWRSVFASPEFQHRRALASPDAATGRTDDR